MAGGELLASVLQRGSYSEETARECFRQLLEGVRYCHGLGVVHRDLKLENLLLEEEHDLSGIRIVDFGLAKGHFQKRAMAMDTVCGTPHYVAPEVIIVRSSSSLLCTLVLGRIRTLKCNALCHTRTSQMPLHTLDCEPLLAPDCGKRLWETLGRHTVVQSSMARSCDGQISNTAIKSDLLYGAYLPWLPARGYIS